MSEQPTHIIANFVSAFDVSYDPVAQVFHADFDIENGKRSIWFSRLAVEKLGLIDKLDSLSDIKRTTYQPGAPVILKFKPIESTVGVVLVPQDAPTNSVSLSFPTVVWINFSRALGKQKSPGR